MSPTAASDTTAGAVRVRGGVRVWGGVYPGYGDEGGSGRVLYRYPPGTLQDPIFNIFSLKAHTHGQMKAILRFPMRFLR